MSLETTLKLYVRPRLIIRKRSHRRHQPVAPRVAGLVLAYAGIAATISFIVISGSQRIGAGRVLPWPIIAAALLMADLFPAKFNWTGHSVSVDSMGVPIALGVAFCSPAGLLAAVATAMAVAWVPKRDRWEKAIFNVLNQTVGASAAYAVTSVVIGSSAPIHLRGVLGVGAGVLAFEVVTLLGVMIAVTVSSGLPGEAYLRAFGLEAGVILPINAFFGVLTVAIAVEEKWGVLLLAGPGLMLALCFRAANVVRRRYANLDLLYRFTVDLAASSDTDGIIAAAVAEVRSIFGCRYAQLTIDDGGDRGCWRTLPDGSIERLSRDLAGWEKAVIDDERPVLTRRGTGERSGEDGYDDLMAVPVRLGESAHGVLLVADREIETETFDSADLRLLIALAAHLSTALTSSDRFDRLKAETAAREYQALHDELTGLANRNLFLDLVSSALAARHPTQVTAVVLVDLDGFTDINDTLGHAAGDQLLREIGNRVAATVGGERWTARLGGDEFAFVVPAAQSPDAVVLVAEAVRTALADPIAVGKLDLELTASAGIAMAPLHSSDPAGLLQRADAAMSAAKRMRRGVVVYDPEIDQKSQRRLTIASDLRRAMEAFELEVWYQPIADITSRATVGFEALLRWPTDNGFLSPAEFIPVAEQTGLIEPLTWWVLERAVSDMEGWHKMGSTATLSVNISARCLQSAIFVERLRALLRRSSVPASSLTLEVTESLMMDDPEWSTEVLGRVADLGVKIAIDDFGTGHSSLSRLKTLPVHVIKIDRSFVMNMHADDHDVAVVQAAIDLARAFGHVAVAEGVESEECWEHLRRLGCDRIQGYVLSAAIPITQTHRWLGLPDPGQQPRELSLSV